MPLGGSVMDGPDLVTAMVDTRTALEEAMAGDQPAELARALDTLAQAWRRHTAGTEAGDGLLQEILDHAPRLGAAADQLRKEHRSVAKELRQLRLRLATQEGPSSAILQEIDAILATMRVHDQAGASLIWETYMSEVVGGE